MAWTDYAIKQIKNDCITTTSQLDDDVIYTDDEIIIAGTTPKELLDLFVEKISNYADKMNFERAGLVFWRMLNSIEYSADMGMYIIDVDRERLDEFVEPQLTRKEIIEEEIIMKKNYVITNEVSSEWIQNVINLSDEDVYPIDTGTAFAYMVDFSNLHYGRVRRHWLVVIPEFQNEWSNAYHAMLTDSEKIANEFIEEYEKQQDSYNDEDSPDFDPDDGEYRYYPELAGRWFDTFEQATQKFFAQFQL